MARLDHSNLSRRHLLAGAAATTAGGLASSMMPRGASAKAPMAGAQAPAFYRLRVGAFEATVVSDGPLAMGEPAADVFVGVSKEQMTKELTVARPRLCG
jgi:hypothetical protein